jgi:hypothetical protein
MSSIFSGRQDGKQGWFRRWFLTPLMIFCFVVALASAPMSARANDSNGDVPIITQLITQIKQGLEQISWLKDIFDFINQINSLLNTFLDKINNSINNVGKVLSTGQQAQIEAAARLTNEKIRTETLNSQTAVMAEVAAAHTPPPTSTHACKSIIANQLPLMYEDFVNDLARSIGVGIGLRSPRGPGAGNGVQYTAIERKEQCAQNGNGAGKTDHPIDNGPCPGTTDANGVAGFSTNIAYWATMSMNLPPLTQKTIQVGSAPSITVNQPVVSASGPEAVLQQRWMGARDLCYQAAGYRPPPPSGAQLTTPNGMTSMAAFDNCAAKESAANYQCGYYVARLTRPSKDSSLFSLSQKACQILQQTQGVTLPTGFDNCQYGLSQLELELANLMLCASQEHATSAVQGGASYPEAMYLSDACAARYIAWQNEKAAIYGNLMNAMELYQGARECWAGVQPTPVTQKTGSAEDVMPDSKTGASVRKTKAQKAEPYEQTPAKGLAPRDAFYTRFGGQSLPATIAQ